MSIYHKPYGNFLTDKIIVIQQEMYYFYTLHKRKQNKKMLHTCIFNEIKKLTFLRR